MHRRYSNTLSTNYEDEVIYLPGRHIVWFQAVKNKIEIQTTGGRLCIGPFEDVEYYIEEILTPAVANSTPQMVMFYNNDEEPNGIWTARLLPILSDSEKSTRCVNISKVVNTREKDSCDEHSVLCFSLVLGFVLFMFSLYLYAVYGKYV